jgi:uncharacterized protein
MSRRFLMVTGILIGLICGASAQTTPTPEAMTAARNLVATMKLADQYRALLPAILLGLKPALVQDRPEIERDYDAMTTTIVDAFMPFYTTMLDDVAKVYASNFTVEELQQIDNFYRLPVGQKLLEKSPAIAQQSAQISQDISRKATDELRMRLTEALRKKGHKL